LGLGNREEYLGRDETRKHRSAGGRDRGLRCSWRLVLNTAPLNGASILLAVVLASFIVLGDHYPIHIRYSVKISIQRAALPSAVLLRCAGAASVTIAMLVMSYLARKEPACCDRLYTGRGRWIIIVLLGSAMASLPCGSPAWRVSLFWAGWRCSPPMS